MYLFLFNFPVMGPMGPTKTRFAAVTAKKSSGLRIRASHGFQRTDRALRNRRHPIAATLPRNPVRFSLLVRDRCSLAIERRSDRAISTSARPVIAAAALTIADRPAMAQEGQGTRRPDRRAGRVPLLRIHTIEIDSIYVPTARRKTLHPETVRLLAEDILENGQKTPIQVRLDGKRYVLIEGLHRLEAAKWLGEKTINAYLVQAKRH